MATVTTPTPRVIPLTEVHSRIRSPLQRLRGYIRFYVVAEGVALLFILGALWYWISLALDYGLFKTFGIDWVSEVPQRCYRALFLGTLFAALVALVRFGSLRRTVLPELRLIFGQAFKSQGRQLAGPWWVRLIGAGAGAAVGVWAALALRSPLLLNTAETLVAALLLAPLAALAALLVLTALLLLILHRRYVILIGGLLLGAYVFAWFLVGLAYDQGITGAAFTGLLVSALMLGPVLGLMAQRLFSEFSDPALALVLERRYPKLLGDRLITAVELADTRQAARLGYSEVMIEQTIREAAALVEEVPVRDAFNWRRLRWQGIGVLLLTVGMLMLVGATYSGLRASWASWKHKQPFDMGAPTQEFVADFPEVSADWFGRNVLLNNTIWLRRAHLIVLEPVEGEYKVGRDANSVNVRVRALKYVLADADTPEGWRALHWADLKQVLGAVPSFRRPTNVGIPEDNVLGETHQLALKLAYPDKRTLDEIALLKDQLEVQLKRDEVRPGIDDQTFGQAQQALADLTTLFQTLDAAAAKVDNKRRLRKLEIPATVTLTARGANSRFEMTMQKQEGNEFTGQLSNLTETVSYRARGEDYATPSRTIIVVPPPRVSKLLCDKEEPAYLYHRLPASPPGSADDVLERRRELRSLRQIERGMVVSTDKSAFDVWAGTHVELIGRTDKPLQAVRMIQPTRPDLPRIEEVPVLFTDGQGQGFRIRFENVRSRIEFELEFLDTDNVLGRHRFEIKPVLDQVPDVQASLPSIRRTAQGYLCSVSAFVPIAVKVTDDHGLEKVEFAWTLTKTDAQGGEQAIRSYDMVKQLVRLTGGPGSELATLAQLAPAVRSAHEAALLSEKDVRRVLPASFIRDLNRQRVMRLPLPELRNQLNRRPVTPLLTLFDYRPSERPLDDDPPAGIDIARLNLKVADVTDVQPRYKMELWVEATDTWCLGEPPLRDPVSNKEGKYTLLLVSENELLTEIGKDEDTQQIKLLNSGYNPLLDVQKKLAKENEDLASITKAEDFKPKVGRVEDLESNLEKVRGITEEVLKTYQGIRDELILNRVNKPMILKVSDHICRPLEEILDTDFAETKKGFEDFRKALETTEELDKKIPLTREAGKEAARRLDVLMARIYRVLQTMEGVIEINRLIKRLQELQEEEQRQFNVIKELHTEILKRTLQGLSEPKK